MRARLQARLFLVAAFSGIMALHYEKDEEQSHLALYRKYRPAHWDEVLGQEHIVAVLQGALDNGKTSHAYLFAEAEEQEDDRGAHFRARARRVLK